MAESLARLSLLIQATRTAPTNQPHPSTHGAWQGGGLEDGGLGERFWPGLGHAGGSERHDAPDPPVVLPVDRHRSEPPREVPSLRSARGPPGGLRRGRDGRGRQGGAGRVGGHSGRVDMAGGGSVGERTGGIRGPRASSRGESGFSPAAQKCFKSCTAILAVSCSPQPHGLAPASPPVHPFHPAPPANSSPSCDSTKVARDIPARALPSRPSLPARPPNAPLQSQHKTGSRGPAARRRGSQLLAPGSRWSWREGRSSAARQT